jgi:ubiquinone/menaquinone biosynthesis C-methylase UbiE
MASVDHFPGYTFPNDEKEQDHMDILGHMFTLILSGKLFLAPIGENPQRILDLGTGTGLWAVDMGQSIPKYRTRKLFD